MMMILTVIIIINDNDTQKRCIGFCLIYVVLGDRWFTYIATTFCVAMSTMYSNG